MRIQQHKKNLFSDLRVSRKCSVRRTGSNMTDKVQHVLSSAEQCPHAAIDGGTYTRTSVTCHVVYAAEMIAATPQRRLRKAKREECDSAGYAKKPGPKAVDSLMHVPRVLEKVGAPSTFLVRLRIQQHKMSPPPLPSTTLAIIINRVQRMGQSFRHGEKKVLQIVWWGRAKTGTGGEWSKKDARRANTPPTPPTPPGFVWCSAELSEDKRTRNQSKQFVFTYPDNSTTKRLMMLMEKSFLGGRAHPPVQSSAPFWGAESWRRNGP